MKKYDVEYIPSRWFSKEINGQSLETKTTTTVITDDNDSTKAGRWLFKLRRVYVKE